MGFGAQHFNDWYFQDFVPFPFPPSFLFRFMFETNEAKLDHLSRKHRSAAPNPTVDLSGIFIFEKTFLISLIWPEQIGWEILQINLRRETSDLSDIEKGPTCKGHDVYRTHFSFCCSMRLRKSGFTRINGLHVFLVFVLRVGEIPQQGIFKLFLNFPKINQWLKVSKR